MVVSSSPQRLIGRVASEVSQLSVKQSGSALLRKVSSNPGGVNGHGHDDFPSSVIPSGIVGGRCMTYSVLTTRTNG